MMKKNIINIINNDNKTLERAGPGGLLPRAPVHVRAGGGG